MKAINKTNNGAIITLPILRPSLAVGDIVTWFAMNSRTLHTIGFKQKTGRVETISREHGKVLVQIKGKGRNWINGPWVKIKDLT